MSVVVKNSWLVQVQDCKGTPLEYLLRDLSTNEKPAFWALDQSEASVSARFSLLAKSEVYKSSADVQIDWKSSNTDVKWESLWMSFVCQFKNHWLLIGSVNSIPLPPYMATEDRMILTVNWYFIGSVNSIPLPPYMATDDKIRLRTIKFLPYREAGVSS